MSEVQNVEGLLDSIEEILEEGASVPLSGGKHIVDVNQVRDYIDQVRLNLPGEIRQAQSIVRDRAQIASDARAQADSIVRRAEEKARILVSEEQVVKAAQQRAAEILATAQKESREMRQTITEYCESMLKTTEDAMTRQAGELHTIRANLRQNAKNAQNK